MEKLMKILVFIMLVLIISCDDNSSTEFNNSDEFRRILFSDNQNRLLSYDFSLNSTSEIIIKNNGENYSLTGNIENICKFGNNIYLLIPESNKILIVDAETFSLVEEVNFQTYKPVKIAFAENATTAYVIHKNADVISILDITVNEYVSDITEHISNPSDIITDGNITAVSNYGDNSISVFSAIDESLITKFDVTPNPVSLEIMNSDKNILVISEGLGKDTSEIEKSAARAEYFDFEENISTGAFNITYGSVSAENANPNKSINSYEDFTLIVEENALLFINGLSRKDARMFFPEKFDDIIYDITDNLVYASKYVQDETYIYSFTPTDNQIRDEIFINYDIISYLIYR